MEEILVALGFGDLVNTFATNEVGVREVLMLSDNDFASLGVTTVGGRALLRNRCRVELEATEDSPAVKRLREFQARRQGRRSASCQGGGNTNNRKPTRKITIGWKHSIDDGMVFNQIFSSKGGGTHALNLGKDLCLEAVKSEILDIFFPNGISRHQGLILGNLEATLATFTGDPLPAVLNDGTQFTLGEYVRQRPNPVRIYLQTVSKNNSTSSTTEEVDDSNRSAFPSRGQMSLQRIGNNQPQGSASETTVTEGSAGSSATPAMDSNEGIESVPSTSTSTGRLSLRRRRNNQPPSSVPESESQINGSENREPSPSKSASLTQPSYVDAGTPTVSFRMNETNAHVSTGPDDIRELEEGFSRLSALLAGEHSLEINREGASSEMLRIYGEPDLLFKRVRVSFLGEPGDDFGGLTKDLYTITWKSILEDFFVGEESMAPFLPLHRQRKFAGQYVAIGRILSHTAALVNEIPARISTSTLIHLIYGPEAVSDEVLLDDFRVFLSPIERYLVQKAQTEFDQLTKTEKSTLVSLYSVHGLLEMPKREEIREQILSMATNELVNKPGKFIALMRKGIPDEHFDTFWSRLTIDAIKYLYKKQLPTPGKVVSAIKTDEDLRAEEEAALHFLQQYVYSLDTEELTNRVSAVCHRVHGNA